MPLGTTAISAKNLPSEPYVITDKAWALTAKKNEGNIFTSQAPFGQAVPFVLPQVGIACELLITLSAILKVTGTNPVQPQGRWPYGILDTFSLGVNGQQNLFDVVGEDLRVRQDAAFPAFTESVDHFPGMLGGNSGHITPGTYPINISWRVPISTELVTLSGGLYAQSPSTTIRCVLGTATPAITGLFNGTAHVSFETPKWTVTELNFIPAYDTKGRIIVPSGISTLHAMTSVDLPLTRGQNSLSLVRGSGNLQRLFMSFFRNNGDRTRYSAAPTTNPTTVVQSLILSYAQKQQPYEWTPASVLLRDNNRDYGTTLPYDYLCFDTLKQTPQRDAVYYPGLTELKIIPIMGNGGTGTAHLVQEDLFQ